MSSQHILIKSKLRQSLYFLIPPSTLSLPSSLASVLETKKKKANLPFLNRPLAELLLQLEASPTPSGLGGKIYTMLPGPVSDYLPPEAEGDPGSLLNSAIALPRSKTLPAIFTDII